MPPTATTARCSWTDLDDRIIVTVLKEHKEKGNTSGAGWKNIVWTDVEARLRAEGIPRGGPKTSSKCSEHWANLKKHFLEVHALRQASGFGWDDGTKKVVATDTVWENYIKAHPRAARWRTTAFPLYDDMHYLVHGVVATGDDAFHPGQSPPPPELPEPDHDGSDSEKGSVGDVAVISKTPGPSRKRTRADTESPTASISMRRQPKGRRHTSQAQELHAVGDAIGKIADALTSGGALATPVRLQKALHLVEDDAEYSSDEEDRIISLFSDNMIVADTYSGIRKKSKRVKFVRDRLARA
ncbi:Myb/SANT-like DNA-binding domain-containing protein [Pholiota molesta]|nr:Myb/SANT-like DNA-binding domain-containing protein [Pholiota molesta]